MRANFKEIYEKNRVALNEYKWWRHETFPDYENLSIKAEIYHGDKEYFFRIGEKTSKTITIERANINTKPFFRDLDKPLLYISIIFIPYIIEEKRGYNR